jgi:uncharacterized membrane protein
MTVLRGLALGMLSTYFLDPQRGRRRRALLRDKVLHLGREGMEAFELGFRDLAHRLKGMAFEARSSFRSEAVDDEILAQRVRSKLGRAVSHPHALQVSAEKGRVLLRGLILEREVEPLLSHVRKVRGLREIETQLETHSSPENIPMLQGGHERLGQRPDILQTKWAPATRLIVGSAGLILISVGVLRRGSLGALSSLLGTFALARSLTNLDGRHLLEEAAGRSPQTIHKTSHIDAPVQEVFSFWSDYQNFPRVLSRVTEVQMEKDGRSRWIARGPGGIPIRWEAEMTRFIPNELISWRSLPSSSFQNSGRLRFFTSDRGGTKIEFDFTYHLPAGVVGRALAKIFGSDPKRVIEESLSQVKTLIEQGPSVRQDQGLRH